MGAPQCKEKTCKELNGDLCELNKQLVLAYNVKFNVSRRLLFKGGRNRNLLNNTRCPNEKRMLTLEKKLKLDENNADDKKILDLVKQVKDVKKKLEECKEK